MLSRFIPRATWHTESGRGYGRTPDYVYIRADLASTTPRYEDTFHTYGPQAPSKDEAFDRFVAFILDMGKQAERIHAASYGEVSKLADTVRKSLETG